MKTDPDQERSNGSIHVSDDQEFFLQEVVIFWGRRWKPIAKGFHTRLLQNNSPPFIDAEDLINRGLLNGVNIFEGEAVSRGDLSGEEGLAPSSVRESNDTGFTK